MYDTNGSTETAWKPVSHRGKGKSDQLPADLRSGVRSPCCLRKMGCMAKCLSIRRARCRTGVMYASYPLSTSSVGEPTGAGTT